MNCRGCEAPDSNAQLSVFQARRADTWGGPRMRRYESRPRISVINPHLSSPRTRPLPMLRNKLHKVQPCAATRHGKLLLHLPTCVVQRAETGRGETEILRFANFITLQQCDRPGQGATPLPRTRIPKPNGISSGLAVDLAATPATHRPSHIFQLLRSTIWLDSLGSYQRDLIIEFFSHRFSAMSTDASIRVTSQGFQATIPLLQDHLNQVGAGREISTQLKELAAVNSSSRSSIQLNLDLKQVERITIAGLNELIGINSLARSSGIRLVLLDVQESVREIFALTRLERMFEFRNSAASC